MTHTAHMLPNAGVADRAGRGSAYENSGLLVSPQGPPHSLSRATLTRSRLSCDNLQTDYRYKDYWGLAMSKENSREVSASTSFVGMSEVAVREPFLGVLRELAEAYHAFSSYSAAHVRELGLTPAQFDVVATLGRTDGLPLSEVARKTLITKGTLTGIIDRLEAKGLVFRKVPSDDRRSFHAVLTSAGEALFARVFPLHIHHLKHVFADMSLEDVERTRRDLRRLRDRFREA